MRWLSRPLAVVGNVFRTLHVVRAPVLISSFAVVALTVPDQTREIYRVMAEDYVQPAANSQAFPVMRVWLTFVIVTLAAAAVWNTTRDTAIIGSASESQTFWTPLHKALWMPALCAVSIPIGLALGLWWAANDAKFHRLPEATLAVVPDLRPIQNAMIEAAALLQVGAWICLAAAASIFLLILVFEAIVAPTRQASHSPSIPVRLARITGTVAAWLVFATTITVLWPIKLPQAIGSVSIFVVFVVVLVCVASLLTAYFDRYRIPALTIVFVMAVLFAALDLNDNHLVTPISVEETEIGVVSAPLDARPASFESWYKSRADLDHYQDKPYPVFIVAAAGGGHYAAQHTATVLARIQDRCPTFAQHVFAISGVSGGTLGAATFASLARRYAVNGPWQKCQADSVPKKGRFEIQTDEFLRSDFLSPTLAAMLFPDFIQRFLPIPFAQLDRARAFEASIEEAWERVLPATQNPFTDTFLKQWRPNGAAPALLANTTDVRSGQRVVIAPFLFHSHQWLLETIAGQWGYFPLSHLHQSAGWQSWSPGTANEWLNDPRGYSWRFGPVKADIKLSTAVSLSARFPWVSPAGSIERVDGPSAGTKFWLVDGGYFENSGIETAIDLVNGLQKYETANGANDAGFRAPVRITLLIVGTDELSMATTEGSMSELLSPIRAMLSARQQRGHLAAYRSYSRVKCYADIMPVCDSGTVVPINLSEDALNLPLGWQLSQATLDLIGIFSGRADQYNHNEVFNPQAKDKAERIKAYLQAANKAGCIVHYLLSGELGDEVLVPACEG